MQGYSSSEKRNVEQCLRLQLTVKAVGEEYYERLFGKPDRYLLGAKRMMGHNLIRSDSGDNSCEFFYVSRVRTGNEVYEQELSCRQCHCSD